MENKRWPECHNKDCMWNMASNKKEGYEYLENTCYHNSDTVPYQACTKRMKNEKASS